MKKTISKVNALFMNKSLKPSRFAAPLLLSTLLFNPVTNADDSLLPPLEPWQGKSESLIVDSNNPWQTPAEKTQLTSTPNYQQTVSYLTKLVDSDQRLHMLSLGKSPQQRDIWLVIASTEGAKTPQGLHSNNKPTLFIQAGIHSGEIDGKDAGLMLLRDITKGDKAYLLEQVNIVFLPILNVDGHERSSAFNRVNQRGPKNMGWRTTAQNLNLNRDYSKADTPEMQLLIQAIKTWQPSLYLDIHVTDGEDYQYDITYGFNGEHGDSPTINAWLNNSFKPQINAALSANNHNGGPLIFGLNSMAFSEGLFGWTAGPRFSNGWGDVRNLPTVLVENHSLKPYRQRVLGTYIFLEKTLEILAKQGTELTLATAKDLAARPTRMTVSWELDKANPELMDFKGMAYKVAIDELTGIKHVNWLGQPKLYKDFPIYWARIPKITVDVPKAYYVPTQFITVIERLLIQGIKVEEFSSNKQLEVSQFTAKDAKFNTVPFEGHMTVSAGFAQQQISVMMSTDWVKVSTDQPLGKLAVALLDPRAPDSLFSWGFFNQMFQRTEYIESYAMVPLAKKMLSDPQLKAEFDSTFNRTGIATADNKQNSENAESLDDLFTDKSDKKMRWLYERSKFYDEQYLKYPVLFQY